MHTPAAAISPSSVADARRALVERRNQLVQRRLAALAEEQGLLEVREPDWEDEATAETAARLLDRLGETERMQLQSIVAALQRIDAGTYGLCAVCGDTIDAERLAAVPEAERCGGCTNHD